MTSCGRNACLSRVCSNCTLESDPSPVMRVYADKVVPDSWRIKNSNDFVTRIPSLLGYQHIGVEVCITFCGKSLHWLAPQRVTGLLDIARLLIWL